MCCRFVVGLLSLSALTFAAMDPDAAARLKKQKDLIGALSRQVMMQQLASEESLRASGDSGVKLTRGHTIGTRPYFSASHVNTNSVNAIHDHANFKHVCGMGEIVAVLNGVEFRTRHNDYGLRMPSTTTAIYNRAAAYWIPPSPRHRLGKVHTRRTDQGNEEILYTI